MSGVEIREHSEAADLEVCDLLEVGGAGTFNTCLNMASFSSLVSPSPRCRHLILAYSCKSQERASMKKESAPRFLQGNLESGSNGGKFAA
jgi:hypothetical protein